MISLFGRDGITVISHIRWAYPMYSMFLAAILTKSVGDSPEWRRWIFDLLWIAAFISSITAVFTSLVIRKLPIEEMRFQILSPIHPVTIGATVAFWFWLGKVNRFLLLAFIVTVFASAVALTRSVLLMIAADIFIGALVVVVGRGRYKIKNAIKKLTIVSGLILFGFGSALAARPTMLNDWALRLTGGQLDGRVSVDDLAILERVAEYAAQWEELGEDWKNMVFGMGVGHEYGYYFVNGYNPRDHTGHGLWVYSLYSGGLLFGWIIPSTFLIGLLAAWKRVRESHMTDLLPLRLAVFFALFSWLVTSFSAHPLISRQSGVVAGILIGFSLVKTNMQAKPRSGV